LTNKSKYLSVGLPHIHKTFYVI